MIGVDGRPKKAALMGALGGRVPIIGGTKRESHKAGNEIGGAASAAHSKAFSKRSASVIAISP